MSLKYLCCVSGKNEDPQPTNPGQARIEKRKKGRSNVLFELLLLGADGSGKSTFIRQMQYIHGHGFNDIERQDMIPFIHANIIDALKILVNQMRPLNIDFDDPARSSDVDIFQDEDQSIEDRLSACGRLWNDSGVVLCFNRKSEYSTDHPLEVSTKYFLDAISRINSSGYLPITEDVFRVRKSTVGVVQYDFTVNDINFKITDVGGEREERENWIAFLAKKITCVIFLAAVDEYDTYLLTDDNQKLNRLQESVELFKRIQSQIWLNHTTFILFLNKKDVFAEKINTVNLSEHFEEYQGFQREPGPAMEFIRRKFQSTQQTQKKNKVMIYTHETCATDTEQMKFVFEAVRDTILQHNLRHYNLV